MWLVKTSTNIVKLKEMKEMTRMMNKMTVMTMKIQNSLHSNVPLKLTGAI